MPGAYLVGKRVIDSQEVFPGLAFEDFYFWPCPQAVEGLYSRLLEGKSKLTKSSWKRLASKQSSFSMEGCGPLRELQPGLLPGRHRLQGKSK